MYIELAHSRAITYVQRNTKGYKELGRRIPLLTPSLLYISRITDGLVPKEHGKSRAHSY